MAVFVYTLLLDTYEAILKYFNTTVLEEPVRSIVHIQIGHTRLANQPEQAVASSGTGGTLAG